MKVYMEVTKDKYKLPLIVADSVQELSRFSGVSTGCIYSALSHAKKKGYESKYIVVDLDQTEE